ncbi:MAG: HAMP domain-containing sensor histidine kinase [bacterium]
MEKLFKQFEELVTKWKFNLKKDDFLVARFRLTLYYSLTAMVILCGSSIVLYNTILSNFAQSIHENIFINPDIAQAILDKAQDILLNRFITIDAFIMFFVIVLGFFLTEKTLNPIKLNMQKQKRFIADASHELRTPIAIVISGLEVNLSNKKLDLSGAKKTLEDTLEEMRDFSELSNTLLDISKYDRSVCLECEPIIINELLKTILEKNKNLAQIKNINIEAKIEASATVQGDKDELCRVFLNILDNAIKYTASGGLICVSDKIISNNYVVTITDNGVGIPENIIGKVFDPFFRADASRNTNGAGLGLTLSKKIIENHNGTIVIKSLINKGTSVIISLPISS